MARVFVSPQHSVSADRVQKDPSLADETESRRTREVSFHFPPSLLAARVSVLVKRLNEHVGNGEHEAKGVSAQLSS